MFNKDKVKELEDKVFTLTLENDRLTEDAKETNRISKELIESANKVKAKVEIVPIKRVYDENDMSYLTEMERISNNDAFIYFMEKIKWDAIAKLSFADNEQMIILRGWYGCFTDIWQRLQKMNEHLAGLKNTDEVEHEGL